MLKYFIHLVSCFVLLWASSSYSYEHSIINQLHIKKILLVVAMDSEAQPVISSLHLRKMPRSPHGLPMQEYAGRYRNLDIMLITNGMDPIYHVQNVGTQAATLSTYLGMETFHPDLVISIGTAGGVEKNGARQKDIYVSQKIFFYDRRILAKGYHEYGLGGYRSISISPLDNQLGLKSGVICSGDSFDQNRTDYAFFINENCAVVDMEAAGVAWVSMLMHTPMFALKGVTNFVKGNNIHDQYEKNISAVTLDLSVKLKKILTALSK